MKYQIAATLKQKEFEAVTDVLTRNGITTERIDGRIACFDSQEEASRVLKLLSNDLPYIKFNMIPVPTNENKQN